MKDRRTYFSYIKKSFLPYILSGLIFSIAVASLIVAHRYNLFFSDSLGIMQNISLNKDRIKTQLREVDVIAEYLRINFPTDINRNNSSSLMFRALDDMKSYFNDATIKLGQIETNGAMNELAVELTASVSSYSMIVNSINYLESLRLPDCEIKSVLIERAESGEVILIIKGALVMPSVETNMSDANNGGEVYG